MHTRIVRRHILEAAPRPSAVGRGRPRTDDLVVRTEVWKLEFSRSWQSARGNSRWLRRLSDDGSDHGGRFEDRRTGERFRLRVIDTTPYRNWQDVPRSPLPDLTDEERAEPSGWFGTGPTMIDRDAAAGYRAVQDAMRFRWRRLVTTPTDDPALRQRFTLMPEYGVDYPVWSGGAVDPRDYGVSAGLCRELRAWQHDWEMQIGEQDRLPSARVRSEILSEGRRLAAALRDEVGAFADVSLREQAII